MIDPIANLNLAYLIHQAKNQHEATKQYNLLQQFLVDNRCTFKDKPMPTLLKPNFISPKQTQTLIYAVEQMSNALNKFIRLYMYDENVRRIMKFSDKENYLFYIDPGYSTPLVISRLDAFLDNYSIKFLEFNCDSPAGLAYSDVLEDGFKELFNEYHFLSEWKIDYIKRQDILLKTLLACYNEFRAHKSSFPARPVIAIVDWEDVSTLSEFHLLEKYFEEKGYDTLVCSPKKFTIKNNRTYADGREVHLVYKRVITRELLDKWEEAAEFVKSIKEGLVCCCNSFRSYIVGSKKVLALITDPQFQHIFNEDELDVIQKTVPWTKILADIRVTYKNVTLKLKDFIVENKDLLVLKPSNSYGGKDVYLGIETAQELWEKIMKDHLHDESWVVQEYVDIPQEIFPEIKEDIHLKLKKVNINPFALLGKYSGTITRVSDSAVINVSAGGGLVPTLKAVRRKDILT
jgi:glutathionylspermidine synthase